LRHFSKPKHQKTDNPALPVETVSLALLVHKARWVSLCIWRLSKARKARSALPAQLAPLVLLVRRVLSAQLCSLKLMKGQKAPLARWVLQARPEPARLAHRVRSARLCFLHQMIRNRVTLVLRGKQAQLAQQASPARRGRLAQLCSWRLTPAKKDSPVLPASLAQLAPLAPLVPKARRA
jgi:hypothetical protein